MSVDKLQKILRERFGSDCHLFSIDLAAGEDAGDGYRWHQIAPEGKFDGHFQGAFELRESHFEQIIANGRMRGNEIVVDYEHNTMNPFAEKAPAAGWLNPMTFDIRATDKGQRLFAKIKWTKPASSMIANDEYRYLSPVIQWNTEDKKTKASLGASIPSVALTNTPFFDDLAPVTLNSLIRQFTGMPAQPDPKPEDQNPMNEEQRKALAKILGLAETSTPESILSACAAQGRDLHALSQVAKACGLDEGVTASAIVAGVTGMRESITALSEENAALKSLADDAKKIKAGQLITAAKAEGKIIAQNEEWATELASKDPEAFAAWCSCAPKIVPTDPKKGAKKDGDLDASNALSDLDKSHADQIGMSHEDYAKYKNMRSFSFADRKLTRSFNPGFQIAKVAK